MKKHDKIKFVAVIDRGGFGRVEKVEWNGKVYARKVFDPSAEILAASDMERLKKRFVREVKVQSALPSHLFIPILKANLTEVEPWFLMPFADRNYEDEIERCQSGGEIPQGLSDILNALEHLHELGYAHRDLKPPNILFHDGRWKLSDLGLVKHRKMQYTTALTSANSAFGSELYCAPEQISDFRHVDHLADIYSFGAILHDFFGNEDRIPYQELTCEGPLGFIIERCTKKDRSKRFQAVAKLRGALLQVLAQQQQAARTDDEVDWSKQLETYKNWDIVTIREFAKFLNHHEESLFSIYFEITEDVMEYLVEQDNGLDYSSRILELYCQWANSHSFDFDYADVIAARLVLIMKISHVDNAILAWKSLLKLGLSHNRYFVMNKFVAVSGPDQDEKLAQRMKLEIQIDDLQENVRQLLEVLYYTHKKSFHRKIQEALKV